MTATSTDTAVRYFIAVIGDEDAVYGIGHSADQAVEDARSNGDPAQPLDFIAQECTQRLYDEVKANGTPRGWTTNVDGLKDLEPEDGLYDDAACTQPLDNDDTLPHTFFHACDGDVVRYWYLGQQQYERHERRTEDGQTFWYGIGSVVIEDDVTAEDYQEYLAA
ncbi:hypothetical protein ABZT49_06130 [Methylobacterium sp. EM32]|uniref:hypothetical protein n=1 Tax=Methylobacterium sp. EM32 TaxID=3163481 RepID=UPI0033A80B63